MNGSTKHLRDSGWRWWLRAWWVAPEDWFKKHNCPKPNARMWNKAAAYREQIRREMFERNGLKP